MTETRVPKRPLKRVDAGIYETPDERYAAFKSTSQWNVSGRKGAVEALAVDLDRAQQIVHDWMVEDAARLLDTVEG